MPITLAVITALMSSSALADDAARHRFTIEDVGASAQCVPLS
jgi:hypothetical protein